MDKATKAMTMMKLGELHCFEEEQRIAILEMVKDGTISMDEAIAEVKMTNPTTFQNLKYDPGHLLVVCPPADGA